MNKKIYLEFMNRKLFSTFLAYLVWSSLGVLTVTSKGSILDGDLALYQSLMVIGSFIGVMVAHSNIFNLRVSYKLDLAVETVMFLGMMYAIIFTGDLTKIGTLFYMIMFMSLMLDENLHEKSRNLEDLDLKDTHSKRRLKRLRKRGKLIHLTGGILGTLLAVLFLTILKVDLLTFSMYILILNIGENIYSYYLYKKYVDRLVLKETKLRKLNPFTKRGFIKLIHL